MKKRQIIIISAMGVLMCVFTLMAYLNNNRVISMEDVSFVVKFDTDGGSPVNSIEIGEGLHIDKPNDPKKDGYIFLSWSLDGKTYDFSSPINNNVTLKANWQKIKEDKKTYFVQFNSNGGTTIANLIVNENELATKPRDPVRDNYEFKGWYLNNNRFDFNTKITKNTVLEARWEKIKKEEENPKKPEENNKPEKKVFYNIYFDSNGGSHIEKQIIEEGNKAIRPINPNKEGYKFIGWYHNDKEFNFNSNISNDIKLVARWKKIEEEKKTFKVTFNSGVGTSVIVEVNEGETVKPTAVPIKEGYNFATWLLGENEFDFNTPIKDNIVLTAKWVNKKYTVSIRNGEDDKLLINVVEDGKFVSVKSIKLSDGTLLGSGHDIEIDSSKLGDSNKFIVELLGGTIINI